MWRRTPQTLLVQEILQTKKHTTNQEIAKIARKTFPTITNTTVHRITARLVDAGLAAYAPTLHSSKVLDSNTTKHDHFFCQSCDRLVDINIADSTFKELQSQLPGRLARNNILISGVCEHCL